MNNPIEIPPGLIARAKAIILTPKVEWPVIADETATIGSLYTKYAIFLAAIQAIAQLIGSLLFGYSFLGLTYRPGVTAALSSAVAQYVMGLVSVAIIAVIADLLAPPLWWQQRPPGSLQARHLRVDCRLAGGDFQPDPRTADALDPRPV